MHWGLMWKLQWNWEGFHGNQSHHTYWFEIKFFAATITSSSVWTITGTLLQPGDFRSRSSTLRVRSTIVGRQTSVLFTITNVGTFSAMANPKCSFVVPTKHKMYWVIKNLCRQQDFLPGKITINIPQPCMQGFTIEDTRNDLCQTIFCPWN